MHAKASPKVYTIGHSNVEFEKFLNLLNLNEIEVLVDVRSVPFSKYVPHFNKENIKTKLENAGIEYVYLGDKLGGKPKDEKYYENGKVHYDLIEKGKEYIEGVSTLIKLAGKKKTVIMCSEENPDKCHRHHLITQTLLRRGAAVFHIRSNGTTERAKKENVQLTLDSILRRSIPLVSPKKAQRDFSSQKIKKNQKSKNLISIFIKQLWRYHERKRNFIQI